MADPQGGAGPDGGPADPPVCYRHPGRETHIRCGRCGRYICPDDMISASVGFQCPDCVRAGNKDVRQPRTVAGGVVRRDAGIVTYVIIGINVALFLAVQGSEDLLQRLWLYSGSGFPDGIIDGEPWRLFTAAFLHQQTLHIALNMLILYLFGRPLEAQLGRARYIATYLICALGGSTASFLFNEPNVPSLGASGAVFGLLGTLLVLERQFGSNPTGVIVYLAILLLPGFVIANIDWRGHIGGLVTGAVLGAAYAYAPRANRTAIHVAVGVGVTLILVAAVQVRTERLKDPGGAAIGASAVVHTVDERCGELHPCNSTARDTS